MDAIVRSVEFGSFHGAGPRRFARRRARGRRARRLARRLRDLELGRARRAPAGRPRAARRGGVVDRPARRGDRASRARVQRLRRRRRQPARRDGRDPHLAGLLRKGRAFDLPRLVRESRAPAGGRGGIARAWARRDRPGDERDGGGRARRRDREGRARLRARKALRRPRPPGARARDPRPRAHPPRGDGEGPRASRRGDRGRRERRASAVLDRLHLLLHHHVVQRRRRLSARRRMDRGRRTLVRTSGPDRVPGRLPRSPCLAYAPPR